LIVTQTGVFSEQIAQTQTMSIKPLAETERLFLMPHKAEIMGKLIQLQPACPTHFATTGE
jgi:hypothetical protein